MTLTKSAEVDLQALLPYLLSGGAGALAGGALTNATPERFGESPEERRKRILRNALMMGTGAAAGHAGLSYGLPRVTHPLPEAEPSQLESALVGLKTNPLYYLGAGGVGGLGLRSLVKGEELSEINSLLSARNTLRPDKTPEIPLAGKKRPQGHFLHQRAARPELFENIDDAQMRRMGINPEELRYRERTPISSSGPSLFSKLLGPGLKSIPQRAKAPGSFGRLLAHLLGGADNLAARKVVAKGSGKLLMERLLGTAGQAGRNRWARGVPAAGLVALPQIISYLTKKQNPEAFNN